MYRDSSYKYSKDINIAKTNELHVCVCVVVVAAAAARTIEFVDHLPKNRKGPQ